MNLSYNQRNAAHRIETTAATLGVTIKHPTQVKKAIAAQGELLQFLNKPKPTLDTLVLAGDWDTLRAEAVDDVVRGQLAANGTADIAARAVYNQIIAVGDKYLAQATDAVTRAIAALNGAVEHLPDGPGWDDPLSALNGRYGDQLLDAQEAASVILSYATGLARILTEAKPGPILFDIDPNPRHPEALSTQNNVDLLADQFHPTPNLIIEVAKGTQPHLTLAPAFRVADIDDRVVAWTRALERAGRA